MANNTTNCSEHEIEEEGMEKDELEDQEIDFSLIIKNTGTSGSGNSRSRVMLDRRVVMLTTMSLEKKERRERLRQYGQN